MSNNENKFDEYIVASHASEELLAARVNKMIQEGWIPLGGVAAYSRTFYQAMIKKGENKNENS